MPKGSIAIAIALISLIAIFLINKPANPKNDGKYDNSEKVAVFHGSEYQVPGALAINSDDPTTSDVLGSRSNEKRIEVDLSAQKLYAYEGNKKVMSFTVSTGKWGLTPTGEFRIWTKLKYTLMKGGSEELGTYYYLPNVPFTMFFYKDFGIHGTYWHNNFGHPMSHGCVNMNTADAEKLFYWANPVLPEKTNSILASEGNLGTRVIIYGETPKE
jgi:lipoprotein-anchoring transpeptidase ErfK/SrfK